MKRYSNVACSFHTCVGYTVLTFMQDRNWVSYVHTQYYHAKSFLLHSKFVYDSDVHFRIGQSHACTTNPELRPDS